MTMAPLIDPRYYYIVEYAARTYLAVHYMRDAMLEIGSTHHRPQLDKRCCCASAWRFGGAALILVKEGDSGPYRERGRIAPAL